MPKDKFKVIRSAVVVNVPEDPLKDLKEAASFLLDVEKTSSSGQLDMDLNRTAIIEIDGNVVWDNREELREVELLLKEERRASNEAEKAKIDQRKALLQKERNKRMEVVKNAFKKLKPASKEKALFNLHQGVMSGAWFTLNNNYCLNCPNGKKIKGLVGIADSLKELKMRREKNIFSYELKAPVYAMQDAGDGSWWGIGPDGKVQEVDEPDSNALQAQGYKPICEISAIAKIDLTKFNKPISSFELEVQSESAAFRYVGPKAPEVLQLENVDLSLKEKVQRIFSAIRFKSKSKEIEKNVEPPTKKRRLSDKVEKTQKTHFQLTLQKKQEDLVNKYSDVIVETLSANDSCKGGIKVEIPGNNDELLNYFQNGNDEIESNLSVKPSYKAIAILFELNEKVFPLEMETCSDIDSLLKLYKVSKFTNQKIIFSDRDLAVLESSIEYQKFNKLDKTHFRKYLHDNGELKTFMEFFEKKKNDNKISQEKRNVIFGDITASGKKRKRESMKEPQDLLTHPARSPHSKRR